MTKKTENDKGLEKTRSPSPDSSENPFVLGFSTKD
jgi:hypothetical protein